MVLKALSMDVTLASFLQPFNNKESRHTDKYAHYLALYLSVPKKYRKTNWIKGGGSKYPEELVDAVCRYFRIRPGLADSYIDQLTKKQRETFLDHCIASGISEAR